MESSYQLFSWEGLSTVGSLSLLIYLVVQHTKTLVDKFIRWMPTDVYAVIVTYFILVLVNCANGADMQSWKVYILSLFNSFLVASISGQIYIKSTNPPSFFKKKETQDINIRPLQEGAQDNKTQEFK